MLLRTVVFLGALVQAAPTPTVTLPSQPLRFGAFTARFDPAGTFTVEGQGWPKLEGTWTIQGAEIELRTPSAPKECAQPARYRVAAADGHPTFALIADPCQTRRMILDRSSWRLASETVTVAPRRIAVTALAKPPAKPFAPATGSWPSFRGAQAAGVADGQQLPDTWNPKTGEHVRWRTPIPGLAHSSPIVWGNRVFVTSAVSSDPKATFRPGLYGDGDASADRSTQRWTLFALDAPTGKIVWERVAFEGAPRELRHIKSTYASATPATDGRLVVAVVRLAGRLRLRRRRHAAVEGRSRPPRRRRLRRPELRVGHRELADHLERSRDPAVRHAGGLVPRGARRRHRPRRLEDRARRAAVVGHADGGDDVEGRRAGHQRLELRPRLRSAHRQGAVAPRAAARRSPRRRRLPPATCSSSPAVERPSGRSSSSRPARAATSR